MSGERHTCPACEALPGACAAALVASRDALWRQLTESESEPGRYWRERADKMTALYLRSQETVRAHQERANRFEARAVAAEKAVRRAERALRRYERPGRLRRALRRLRVGGAS